ncbi:MAG TPA: RagB/SusD family nutrient uptake outer membrane protein [Gemmatimonadales bacterium]|nr:RagB/SusD family nutrient uptake outer membrane protein [Gemmatimonadales bacterium]
MRPILKAVSAIGLGGALMIGACNFEITNPNAPTEIGNNASPQRISGAMNGLLIATRGDVPNWILKAAILGREGYRIDPADPRFVSELITATNLDPSNGAFGGGQWLGEYNAIRSGYNVLNVVGTAQLTSEQREGVIGFTQTLQAYNFMLILFAHTEDSIPIDVNRPLSAPLAPFVTNDQAWQHVVSLLDSGATHLQGAGSAFSFSLPAGFASFNTPATFVQLNRALEARADLYRASQFSCATCYDDALTALSGSFVDTTQSLDLGAYFDFSANSGDVTNGLSQQVTSSINLVHPSLRDSLAVNGGSDARYSAKVAARGSQLCDPLAATRCSDLSWIRYPTPSSPIPLIRNEELILIRAEANNNKTARDAAAAAADINFIRVNSGGYAANAGLSGATQQAVQDEIMIQRKYSLLYEGLRWVDMRRTGRLNQLTIDVPATDHIFSTLPVNSFEVQARP